MKKSFYTVLLLTSMTVFVTTGCKSKKENPLIDSIFYADSSSVTATEIDTLKTEIIKTSKKIPLDKNGEKFISFSSTICYPFEKDTSKLAQIIRDWTSKQMSYCIFNSETEPELYKGSNTKAKLMAEHYMRTYVKQSQDDINEFTSMSDDASEEGLLFTCEYEISTKKHFENSDYITFISNAYSYAGGAHGSTNIDYLTINKHTNKKITWNELFDKKNLNKIMKLVKAKFIQQFIEDGSGNFDDALILDEQQRKKELPIPATAPGLSISGIEFLYNQYEIACYAAGVLSVTLSYNEISEYLKPEAKKLLMK